MRDIGGDLAVHEARDFHHTMTTPAVSVAMSVYNGERFLVPAIESVLAQTMDQFEFLILDDGSHDQSRIIAEQTVAVEQESVPLRLKSRNRRSTGDNG